MRSIFELVGMKTVHSPMRFERPGATGLTGGMMSREHVEKLKMIFEAAVARAPEERNTYLDQACQRDVGLRKELEQLLWAHDLSGQWIDCRGGDNLAMPAGLP